MTACVVRGVSVFGPGLNLWAGACRVLSGETELMPETPPLPLPAMLAPNERRRSGLATRLALAVCSEAVAMAGLAPSDVAVVFASSNGEGEVVHGLLERLASPEPLLSPTQFHNSVHNTAAGYWSIGGGSMQPATCLGCHDWSFAAGLLKAVAETCTERRPTLLCVYDAPMPEPLQACRPMGFPFASALVLSPEGTPGAVARLDVQYVAEAAAEADGWPDHPGLRTLAGGNQAARALRLLELLALGRGGRFALPYLDGQVQVEIAA